PVSAAVIGRRRRGRARVHCGDQPAIEFLGRALRPRIGTLRVEGACANPGQPSGVLGGEGADPLLGGEPLMEA
ncbi:MAG TPA: hypothetical protein VK821_10865, partial [Dehalococcoidia bacterium]|nr:hypothetical protein [Dehalococcoidia bacterium]